jgi:WD40 repeat protein
VAFSSDGQLVASGGQDRAVKLWSATPTAPVTFTGHDGAVHGLAFLPQSQRLVSGAAFFSTRGRLKLWDATTSESLEPSFEACPEVNAVALHRDCRHLATACTDWTSGVAIVRVWDLETGRPVWEQKDRAAWAVDVAYSSDGRWLASAGVSQRGQRGVVMLRDAETGREIRTFEERAAGVHGLAFSPDSRQLASGWGDGILRIREIEDPAGEAREHAGHAGGVRRVAYLPDGRLASAGGRSAAQDASALGEVKIWDLATGRVRNLRGHTGRVEGLACSPDGRRLATGSDDRTVKLWDTTTGEEVFTLRGHTAGVICVAFSPDGRRIASGGWDRTVKVWDTSPPASDVLSGRGAGSRVGPAEFPADPFAR